jgi:hypothetical protein
VPVLKTEKNQCFQGPDASVKKSACRFFTSAKKIIRCDCEFDSCGFELELFWQIRGLRQS